MHAVHSSTENPNDPYAVHGQDGLLVAEPGDLRLLYLQNMSQSVTSRKFTKINHALKFCFVVELEIPP